MLWFVNYYISEPIRKIVCGFKDKVANLFNTNTPKQIVYGRRNKIRKPKTQRHSGENKINSIRFFFTLKKEIKYIVIKDKIIRDIRAFFEEEEDYYKLKRVSNLWNNNYIKYESKKLITKRIS